MAATIQQNGGNLELSGTIRASMYCYNPPDAQMAINTMHYRYAKSAGTTMTFGEVAKALCDAISNDYKALLQIDCNFIGVKVAQVLPNPLPLPGIATDPGSGIGGATCLPTQSSAIIRWRTPISGPAGRGRLYVPFPSTDDVNSDGSVAAPYLTKMDDLRSDLYNFNAVVGAGATYNFTPVIYHRPVEEPFPIPASTTDLTGSVSWVWFATQRRRGAYGRVNSGVIT